ncbi:hypothetical protein C465_04736 [Halorubrum distributum JCM 9100]|uniref:Uncharacterized protein n=5 Tax=Halorubrum distributum TaxID=29283 RepID=M0ET24_9EURY|nr:MULTISPECIES: hypothetical protein [Halorubrum distributum group]ELZ35848.1 hypothetical protein C473_02969 [Halorubrum terrestre JCM 10247]ELZ50946.1 hypothetical protein C465_04736 [Halorubrum distributum JCM 9100]ELZ52956.1 hypothetical protein C466_10372 [Halorubrum distributum JCM 10118]EMA63441.1 hypothetical protein C470_03124 [Halorubrum litoreum JCM 13561]EMA72027.1 hypothetical protein C462_03705 [Halorubrum arcis JCM 13916]
MPTLDVELNGETVHDIDAPDSFVTDGPFPVVLENSGRSTHVHLHFDDDLDRVTAVDEVNHYVADEATRHVHVSTADVDEPVRGKLKIVTGYGSNTTYVDVRVDPSPETPDRSVAVDEELSAPPERTPEPPARQRAVNALDRLVQRGGVAGAVFGLVAVGVAVGVAMAVDSAVVWLAVGIALMVAFGAALLSVT